MVARAVAGVNVKTFGVVRTDVPATGTLPELSIITFASEAAVDSALLNVTATEVVVGT